jgi:hypothetical protein
LAWLVTVLLRDEVYTPKVEKSPQAERYVTDMETLTKLSGSLRPVRWLIEKIDKKTANFKKAARKAQEKAETARRQYEDRGVTITSNSSTDRRSRGSVSNYTGGSASYMSSRSPSRIREGGKRGGRRSGMLSCMLSCMFGCMMIYRLFFGRRGPRRVGGRGRSLSRHREVEIVRRSRDGVESYSRSHVGSPRRQNIGEGGGFGWISSWRQVLGIRDPRRDGSRRSLSRSNEIGEAIVEERATEGVAEKRVMDEEVVVVEHQRRR